MNRIRNFLLKYPLVKELTPLKPLLFESKNSINQVKPYTDKQDGGQSIVNLEVKDNILKVKGIHSIENRDILKYSSYCGIEYKVNRLIRNIYQCIVLIH